MSDVADQGYEVSITRQMGHYRLQLPAGTWIDLEAATSAVDRAEVATSAGKCNTVNGPAMVRSPSLAGLECDYTLGASNGRITVENVRGAFDIRTSNGSIEFNGELLPGGDNRIRTSNGSVSINLPGLPRVSLDASTSNGSVVSRIPMTTISSEKTHLRAIVGNGDAELSVQTSNCSITFR